MQRPALLSTETCLETPRLYLRTMRAGDIDDLHAIFTDPEVMAAFDSSPLSRQQTTAWLQRNLDHQASHGYGLFSIILKENGLLIGDCGLEMIAETPEIPEVAGNQVAELGYDLRSDFWNCGYATEAATAVRDDAFARLCLPRLISLIRIGNQRSRRVAEKVGMRYVSERVQHGHRYWQFEIEAAILPT